MDVEKLVREYIDKTIHLSLATVRDNKPWVCEAHFAYDENLNLYFRSLKSRRHSQEIVGNPNVAGDIIDKYALGDPVVGLYFEGKAELLGEGDAQDKAFECLKSRLGVSEEAVEEAKRSDGHQFYKINVKTFYIFGKFDDTGAQKYELSWNGGKK
jgi:uncharacterized protein YhbP (UPF0306 family)